VTNSSTPASKHVSKSKVEKEEDKLQQKMNEHLKNLEGQVKNPMMLKMFKKIAMK
jgi:uncharacterized protein Yka (UPF0111/DUF47 family)